MGTETIQELRKKIAERKAEKEREKAIKSYQIITTEENGQVKTINHPVSSFGGGTFFEYYSGDADSLKKPKR